MPLTNFPHGVSSFGMPQLGSGGIPATTGNVFFVDSGAANAADGNAATSPSSPAATIDGAIGKCTANNGDQIIVMPGHSESGFGTITMDVAGVSVFGLGQAFTRPQLVYTATTDLVSIVASNCRWSNIIHVAGVAEVVSGIDISGPGSATATEHNEVDHCRWTFSATGFEFAEMMVLGDGGTDSANYCNIHDNWFEAEILDGCGTAILIDDCNFTQIVSNRFSGDFNTPVIMADAGSSVCKDFYIVGNHIENKDTGTTCIFQMEDATTGIVGGNWFATELPDPEVHFDQGECWMLENYGADDATNVNALLVPLATAT